jgi:osmotically-inducible protein OsmY
MTTEMETMDVEIQEAVLRELRWDAHVDAAHIGVVVDEGVVTLSGTVPSWGKRTAAQEAAHRVRGVLDVANELRVHVPGGIKRTDTEIAKAVRHALAWNVFVPDESILSTVSEGWVTLEGTLDSWTQKEDAENAVRDLTGVVGVTSRIEVVPPRTLMKSAIEEALERRASREAKRVDLSLREGHVIVSGTVQSWPEKQAVLGAIKGTAGVASVEDRLRITPFAT